MGPQPRIIIGLLAALSAAVVGTAACTSGGPSAGPSSSPPRSSQPGTVQPSQGSSPVHPVACAGGWRTGPLTVTRQVTVPPVPVATKVRTGSHPDCRFDRLVIDISQTLPGYSARFVTKVIGDPSGREITLPGSRYLLITLKPAQGHTASGKSTLPASVQVVGGQMLKAWAVSGDNEGVLHIALGLAGGSRYRVGELGGRIYVDVAW